MIAPRMLNVLTVFVLTTAILTTAASDTCPANDPACKSTHKRRTRELSEFERSIIPDIPTGVPGYTWDNPFADHNGYGVEFDKKGDMTRCVHAFRAASRFQRTPTTLKNLAVALKKAGKIKEALYALHESRMEGTRYGGTDRRVVHKWMGEWNDVVTALEPNKLPEEIAKWYKKEDMEYMDVNEDFPVPLWRGGLKGLVKFKCDDKSLRIAPGSLDDRSNYELQLDKAAEALAACGVVVLSGAVRDEHADNMFQSSQTQFKKYIHKELTQGRQNHDARGECSDCETHNISVRSPGRYEIKVPFESPWTDEETYDNAAVRGVMRRLMGRIQEARMEIDTYSVVTAIAQQAGGQEWHADVDPFYRADEFFGGGKVHLPPFGFVNFIPLADVPMVSGPTEFLPKSHIQCQSANKSTRQEKPWSDSCKFTEKLSTWHATAKKGDSVLFDLRTYHRGGLNKAKTDRPQVYLTFMRDNYYDNVNFVRVQTKAFDTLRDGAKRRLARVDHIAYVQKLEEEVMNLKGEEVLENMRFDPVKAGFWRKGSILKAPDLDAVAV